MSIKEILKKMREYRFPHDRLFVRPIAMGNGRGLPALYADTRAYHNALDEIAEGEWETDGRIAPGGVVVRLVIHGDDKSLTRAYVGDAESSSNVLTTAWTQAMRKVCEAFGLGRYLWSLKDPGWFDVNERGQFVRPDQVKEAMIRKFNI